MFGFISYYIPFYPWQGELVDDKFLSKLKPELTDNDILKNMKEDLYKHYKGAYGLSMVKPSVHIVPEQRHNYFG